MSKTAEQALADFLNVARVYMGKEIELPSAQYFSIDYNLKDETKPQFHFQYGFPQSGSVSVSYICKGEYKGYLEKLLVTAPSADRDFTSIVFDKSEELVEGLDFNIKFGADLGLIEHKTLGEIKANPNAIRMIELATEDLSKAVILGKCRDCVDADSKIIPYGKAV